LGSIYEKEKVLMRQENTESAICMDTVAESGEVRELSACELDMISGGFLIYTPPPPIYRLD
jgi:hypothetical protein